MERDRPDWGVTNDAVVRLLDHAPQRAICTNVYPVFVQTTRLAMSIRTLTRPHQLVASARAGHGHNFAPQELVDLIVERTLTPLAEERLKVFEAKAEELKSGHRPKAQRRDELLKLDPAEAALDLKVLDPAMGSGHFLVTAVDCLADYIAELIEYVPAVPGWLDGEYVSPLVGLT